MCMGFLDFHTTHKHYNAHDLESYRLVEIRGTAIDLRNSSLINVRSWVVSFVISFSLKEGVLLIL